MRLSLFLFLSLNLQPLAFSPASAAMTQRFAVYQGRYTSGAVPSNGNVAMEFRVTDGGSRACGAAVNGSTVFWTSGSTAVFTTNGLFSYRLGNQADGVTPDSVFGAINWGGRDYYIDVCVNGASLNPKEPIGAGIYSYYSNFASSASFATAASAILAGGAGTAAVIDSTQTFTGQNSFDGQVTVSSSIFVTGPIKGSNGLTLTAGNLGVGLASPAFAVDVSAGANDVMRLTHPVGGVATKTYLALTNGTNGGVSGRVGSTSVGGGNASMVFEVNNGGTPGGSTTTEALRILNTGNVGIGTATPGQKLSVAGTVESTSGGFRFPDGTTQITASAAGATGVAVVAGTQTFSGSNTFTSSVTVRGALGLDGALNLNNGAITGLATPSASTDGATKGYVDAATAAVSGSLVSPAYVASATSTLADIGYVATATGSLASTAYVASATSALASTGYVATATGSLASTAYVAAATVPFANAAYLASNQTFTGLNTFTSSATFNYSNVGLAGITVSSGLIVSNGYVGIAVAAPLYRADIASLATDVMRLTHNTGGTGNHTQLALTVGTNGGVTARVGAVSMGGGNGSLVFEVNNNNSQGSSTTNEAVRITNAGNVGIGTTLPSSTLHVNGSMTVANRSVVGGTTATATDNIILVDASGGAATVTLPAASATTIGRIYHVIKSDTSGNTVSVAAAGSDTVGPDTATLGLQGSRLTIIGIAVTAWSSK